MLRKILLSGSVVVFAFSILIISVLRTASDKYSYKLMGASLSDSSVIGQTEKLEGIYIDYYLPSPGSVLPDSPWWGVKALRDKIWLMVTSDPKKEAELNLLLADKRLVSSQILYAKGKYTLGFTTLSKAEKYLVEAGNQETKLREKGTDTVPLAMMILKASYKHRQMIKQIQLLAPDDGRSDIVIVENTIRGLSQDKYTVLSDKDIIPPPDPFNGL
jgi:hypothetical protein